jgi:membrane-associated phospholipid phosphatase
MPGLAERVIDRLGPRLDPAQRYGLRLTLFAIALALVGIPFGFFLDQVLREGPMLRIDTWAANTLHEIVRESDLAVTLLQIVSYTGKPIFFVIVCVPVGLFLLKRGHFHLAVFIATATILGGLVDTWVKLAVNRDRPSLEDPVATAFGHSFPSGHSMMSLVTYGALLLIFLPVIRRRGLAIAVVAVWVLAIGFSRLALGVHFISDVLGGYALGAAWLALNTAAFEIWREDRGLRHTKPLEEGVEPEAEEDLHVHAAAS